MLRTHALSYSISPEFHYTNRHDLTIDPSRTVYYAWIERAWIYIYIPQGWVTDHGYILYSDINQLSFTFFENCIDMLLVSLLYRHVTGVDCVSTCDWCRLCIDMLLVSTLHRHVTGVAFVSTCYWCRLCIVMLLVSPLYRHFTGVDFVSSCYWCRLCIDIYWCRLCIDMLLVSPLYRHVTGVNFVTEV